MGLAGSAEGVGSTGGGMGGVGRRAGGTPGALLSSCAGARLRLSLEDGEIALTRSGQKGLVDN